MPLGRKEYLQMNNTYNIQAYNRSKLFCRIHFGLELLFRYPSLVITFAIEFIIFLFVWNNRMRIVPSSNFYPKDINNAIALMFSVCLIIILVLFWIASIVAFAFLASRRDEANLEKVFSDTELQHGCPILFSRTKQNEVIIRDFYSPIPLYIWEQKKAKLCHMFNSHFVNPEIEYRGKNSKYIRLHTAPGIVKKDRGLLYDNTF